MSPPLRVLHALHDYLPRHQAGSELYVSHLSAAQRRIGHQPSVLAADYDPSDGHGRLRWRAHEGVPVAEIVNTWQAATFEQTYDDPVVAAAASRVLDALQPHVLHVHNLLNLAFGLLPAARHRRIAVVATLHDYTLVCPSGGQRVHRSQSHLCKTIDPARCARCFPESPFHDQWRVGRIARQTPGRMLGRAAQIARRLAPRTAAALAAALGALPGTSLDAEAIERRLAAARDVFALCDVVVSPSASVATEFASLGFPLERIVVSDYGFPPMTVPASAPAGGRLRIGFIGTLVWHKGADLLVEATRLLPGDRIVVTIYGDEGVFPQYSANLRRRASGLPIAFEGRVEHARVAEALAGIDVLVVPSRWLENSPLVIHEAFQAGVPVIGAAIGGIPDLLADGRGLCVAPDDAAAIAAAIRGLIDDPSRLTALRTVRPPVKSIDEDADEWRQRYQRAIARQTRALAS